MYGFVPEPSESSVYLPGSIVMMPGTKLPDWYALVVSRDVDPMSGEICVSLFPFHAKKKNQPSPDLGFEYRSSVSSVIEKLKSADRTVFGPVVTFLGRLLDANIIQPGKRGDETGLREHRPSD